MKVYLTFDEWFFTKGRGKEVHKLRYEKAKQRERAFGRTSVQYDCGQLAWDASTCRSIAILKDLKKKDIFLNTPNHGVSYDALKSKEVRKGFDMALNRVIDELKDLRKYNKYYKMDKRYIENEKAYFITKY